MRAKEEYLINRLEFKQHLSDWLDSPVIPFYSYLYKKLGLKVGTFDLHTDDLKEFMKSLEEAHILDNDELHYETTFTRGDETTQDSDWVDFVESYFDQKIDQLLWYKWLPDRVIYDKEEQTHKASLLFQSIGTTYSSLHEIKFGSSISYSILLSDKRGRGRTVTYFYPDELDDLQSFIREILGD